MLFRHRNNTDVAVEVLKQFFIKEKREYSIKVQWVLTKPSGIIVVHVGGMPFTQRLRIPMNVWSRDWGPIILEEGETWRDYYFEKIKGPCARESAERFKAFQQMASGAKSPPERKPEVCSVRREKEVGSAP